MGQVGQVWHGISTALCIGFIFNTQVYNYKIELHVGSI